MIISVVLIVVMSSCGKEAIPQDQPLEDEIVSIAIEPEFDGLEVDVKSLEIGKVDILCYAYDGTVLLDGFPRSQSEINNGTYFYDVPTKTSFLVFSSNSEDVALQFMYSGGSINDIYIGYTYIMLYSYSEVTCTNKPYYMSKSSGWYGQALSLSLDNDCDIGTVTLSNMQRDCKLMFNFTGMPEGETAETYVDKIHVKVGGMSLDKVLTMEDLASETVEEETLWCKTIYTVMGYDLFGEGFRTMDIIIECTDGKIFVVDQFKYNYIRNEQQRININFSTQE